jgi:RNA polymerase sigma-70 factor (ECF subfamily)
VVDRDDEGTAPGAKSDLLEEHLAGLRAFVHLRLGSRLREKEESQDLVQSVCREVLADPSAFERRAGTGFREWLHRAAENKIRDRWRYWRRERRDVARETPGAPESELVDLVTPSRAAGSREELARLERAFLRLPPDYREVIVLARLRGLSHESIAAKLGRTELATRTLLSRALARLAFALEDA